MGARLGDEPDPDVLERGVEIGAGSDTPITTLDPIATVAALEQHHEATQRLSREEAVRLCTLGRARLGQQEDKKGSLEPGKHADFVAYDVDTSRSRRSRASTRSRPSASDATSTPPETAALGPFRQGC